MIKKLAILFLVFDMAACTPTIQREYILQTLTHNPRPILPKITSQELACLDKVTYQKLFDRQRLITSYAIELETIIDSTKPSPKD